jgi:hypothetical protein
MSKKTPKEDYVDEIHRSLCKFFDAKFRSDWKNHEVACERWFDEGFRFDLTSFTFKVNFHNDPIGHLTNTDFKQNFARLENALERVKKELKSSAIEPLLRGIDIIERKGRPITSFYEEPETHFSSKFKISVEKILRQIEIEKFSQKTMFGKKRQRLIPLNLVRGT